MVWGGIGVQLLCREAVYESIHCGLSVGAGALVDVEATFSGIKVVQRVDAHSMSAEKAGQCPCVLEVAVEAVTEYPGNRRAFRANFSHRHGVATAGEGPREQYTDIAPIGLCKASSAGASVIATGLGKIIADAVDLCEVVVIFYCFSPGVCESGLRKYTQHTYKKQK